MWFALRPEVAELAAAAAGPGAPVDVAAARGLLFGPSVSVIVLLLATTLSVLKPWGRVPWASTTARNVP